VQASLSVIGVGSSQTSVIAVDTGAFGGSGGTAPLSQGVVGSNLRGTAQVTAIGAPTTIVGSPSALTDATGAALYGNTAPTGFVIATPNARELSGVPVGGTLAATNYGILNPIIAGTVPSGVGTSRVPPATTLTGQFAGIGQTLFGSTSLTPAASPYIVAGAMGLTADPASNRIFASFGGADPLTSGTSGVSNITLGFGGIGGSAPNSAFIDNNLFAATESTNNPASINGQTLTFGGSASNAAALYFVNSNLVPYTALPAGVSYCACQFLQWGYWGGEIATDVTTGSVSARRDRFHLGTWVAGVQTPQTDINTMISQGIQATYTGHVIGTVNNNGANYLATGALTGTYNFGLQQGTLSVNNFDSRSVTLPVSGIPGTAFYGGSFTGTITGTANGQFYGPLAAETGGNFTFKTTSGTPYFATGIFAGKR